MVKESTDFESYRNMIYKLALSKYRSIKKSRPDIQFEDLHSEAMLIYTMCLRSYKGSKNTKFSTYLYTNLLGRLKDYCNHTLKPITHYEDFNRYLNAPDEYKRYEDYIVSYYDNVNNKELFESAKEKLSYEGYQVFKFILSMEWVSKKVKTKPSVKSIMEKFGYEQMIVESILGEIRDFWNNEVCAVA